MPEKLIPLFETYKRFLRLDPNSLSREQAAVIRWLESFPENLDAVSSYRAVKGFLLNYAANSATFNAYRSYIERLLLWTLLILKKSLLTLTRQDFERFMTFCLTPPADWVGPIVRSRYQRVGGSILMPTDTYVVNPEWRPFNHTVRKQDRKFAEEQRIESVITPYKMKKDSISMTFSVCGSFFEWMANEGLSSIPNPIHAIKQKSRYRKKSVASMAHSLTSRQWDFVFETAQMMADQEPEMHERTLFIVATMYSLYLKVTDIVGRNGREPMMRDFRKDDQGNWWFYVINKGEEFSRVSVKDEYIRIWMSRYRLFLGLTPEPFPEDDSPLLHSLRRLGGLCDRRIRDLVQDVFDKAYERMRIDGFSEDDIKNLRSASPHWLRDTSALIDAQVRDHKHLQADLGHQNLSSTLDRYYYRDDQDRHRSNKS